jgi:hypothetical protein
MHGVGQPAPGKDRYENPVAQAFLPMLVFGARKTNTGKNACATVYKWAGTAERSE